MKYILTKSVSHLKITSIKMEQKYFPDGELYIRVRENIRNMEVKIITNITSTNLSEILFVVDAAKRAGAIIKEIIIPYAGYARQCELRNYGESITGGVVFSLLNNLKIPVKIYDVHSELLRKYLDFENVSFLPGLLRSLPKKDYIVVSPDKGSYKRALMTAKLLKCKAYIINKNRTGNDIYMSFNKDLGGRDVLIVDDIISTGGTLVRAYEIIKKNNAGNVYGIITHGVFSNNMLSNLLKTGFKKIVVSNTLAFKENKKVKIARIENSLLNITDVG